MGLDVGVPVDYQNAPGVTFIAANGTNAKILVDVLPSGGGGNQGFPASTTATGGGRIMDMTVSSTDTSKDVIPYVFFQTTLYANMTAATTTATTNATITRTANSFITDGYKVGDLIMVFGSVANDGILATVTTVAALTLTLNGVPTGWTANTEGAGFRVCRVHPLDRINIPANSGTAATTSNVSLLNNSYDASNDRSGFWLGANSGLAIAMQAAVAALPAYVSVEARIARY